MESRKLNEEINGGGGGGGGHSHTQRITNFGTTCSLPLHHTLSSIPTLTIKKLFSFVCGMKNKL